MFQTLKATAIVACILLFSVPADVSGQTPQDRDTVPPGAKVEPGSDSEMATGDDQGVPFWLEARIQPVLPSEGNLMPAVGVGGSVMPWEHFGFQGRISGAFSPVFADEPWDHVLEATTMFAWYDAGDVGHVSVGAGPSLVRGEFYESVGYEEYASRWFVTGGVAAEVQAGVHLGQHFALTLVVSGTATPETSYVAAAPTLQIGDFK